MLAQGKTDSEPMERKNEGKKANKKNQESHIMLNKTDRMAERKQYILSPYTIALFDD